MKRFFVVMIVALSVGAGLVFFSAGRSFSREDERPGAESGSSNPLSQTGSASYAFPEAGPAGENLRMPLRLDHSLHFEAKKDRGTASTERGIEATIFIRRSCSADIRAPTPRDRSFFHFPPGVST
jgi:hypothetical protein